MDSVKAKKELKLKSYAKVNLSLDVIGKRDDGYHLVETVMQQVSLHDDIYIGWKNDSSGKLNISLSAGKPYLPTDARNLAYKAALMMAEQCDPSGKLDIKIIKRIPVAAGLGGGSSNCAAVMIALNRIWELGFDTRELCALGANLGADVPFCILCQNSRYSCALGTGIGDELHPIVRGLKKFMVLAKPAFGVSTKDVFKGIDGCVIEQRPDTDKLIEALKKNEDSVLYSNMVNVLEEYTLKNYPEVETLKKTVQGTEKVEKVLMSGSGPTVMGIYDEYGAAKNACLKIREQGYEAYWTTAGKIFRGEKNVKF